MNVKRRASNARAPQLEGGFERFSKEFKVGQPKETKNKALVLEAFDTLFNKRDYLAAERFWSPDYI